MGDWAGWQDSSQESGKVHNWVDNSDLTYVNEFTFRYASCYVPKYSTVRQDESPPTVAAARRPGQAALQLQTGGGQ